MSDFEAKHEELYLDELVEITINTKTKEKVFDVKDYMSVIYNFDINRDNGYQILKILYHGLKDIQLQNILSQDYRKKLLRNVMFDQLQIEFIDFLFATLTKEKLKEIINSETFTYSIKQVVYELYEMDFINFLVKREENNE